MGYASKSVEDYAGSLEKITAGITAIEHRMNKKKLLSTTESGERQLAVSLDLFNIPHNVPSFEHTSSSLFTKPRKYLFLFSIVK